MEVEAHHDRPIKQLPTNWRTEEFCKELSGELSKCIVILFLVYKIKGNESPNHIAYTGFLYHRKSFAYWITAGHAADGIKELFNRNDVEVCTAELSDRSGSDEECSVIIAPDELTTIVSLNKQGIDLGFLPLRLLYYKGLATASENHFITPDSLGPVSSADSRGVYLLGCPSETQCVVNTKLATSTERSVSFETICLPIERVSIPGEYPDEQRTFWINPNAFYGQLVPYSDSGSMGVTSIQFMSGGPVFSLEPLDNDNISLKLIGVQSSWLRQQRIIRATSSLELDAILEHWEGIVTAQNVKHE